MLGYFSHFLVICCVAVLCESGSELVRNKRSWPSVFGDDPYGSCGEPTTPIPNGGIKLFPISDFDDPHNDECYTTYFGIPSVCEPKFYCDDGYEKNGEFHLECVRNDTTNSYEWVGSIPTCDEVEPPSIMIYVIPALVIPGVLIFAVIFGAIRRNAVRRNQTTMIRQGIRTTTIHITPTPTPAGRRTLGDILGSGAPPYTRFNDCNVSVPCASPAPKEAMEQASPPPAYNQAVTM